MASLSTQSKQDTSELRYNPTRHPARIEVSLASNEGRAPNGWEIAGLGTRVERYPSVTELEQALAHSYGVGEGQILVTAGIDDALLRISMAFGSGSKTLIFAPTFEMIPFYLKSVGGALVTVDWPGGNLPLEELNSVAMKDLALIMLVTPNNPTGAAASMQDLEELRTLAPNALLVVDHAYVEFGGEDLTERALALQPAVVLRTFSKAWGLAGLRLGYVIGAPEILEQLARYGNPYPVASPSVAIGLQQWKLGVSSLSERVSTASRERDSLYAKLDELGMEPEPSYANFVYARGASAIWAHDALASLRIGVRKFEEPRAVRITCPLDATILERVEKALDVAIRPQAFLFDMDGVLADVSQSLRAAIIKTARVYGVELGVKDIDEYKAAGNANDDWLLTQALLRKCGVNVEIDEVTQCFEGFYQGDAVTPGLHERETLRTTRECLEAWREIGPLAVVTGRVRADAERFLERFGLTDLFDTVVAREDAALKPNPEPVRLALARLELERAWMFGDTKDDFDAAFGAGVVSIGIRAKADAEVAVKEELLSAGAARAFDSIPSYEELVR